MDKRDYELDELVERVARLESLAKESPRLTDVDGSRETWLAENLRLLSVIGSLGPGELGHGTDTPGVSWGPLDIVEPLHGEIWLARHRVSGNSQWLRLLPPAALDGKAQHAQFEAQAEALSGIDLDGLARVRGAAAHEGRSGVWVDACEGRWLSDEGALPLAWTEACDLVIGIAGVLTVLHQRGLVERRLTPDRILMTASGPVFVDFGPGGPPEDDRAPEVRRGAAPTVRSDVYGLGRLFCRLAGVERPAGEIAGLLHAEPERRPPTATAAIEVLRAAREAGPPPVLLPVWRRILGRKSS